MFKRPPTWGEGLYPASWGTVDMMWGGSFVAASELQQLGDVRMDATPSENVFFALTPNMGVRIDVSVSEDVNFGA